MRQDREYISAQCFAGALLCNALLTSKLTRYETKQRRMYPVRSAKSEPVDALVLKHNLEEVCMISY
eukprot:6481-Heterococcus_DN1.PRE.2